MTRLRRGFGGPTRWAVAAVSLAIVAAWAGTPLVAGRDGNTATYACGTAFGGISSGSKAG